jgi:hypothetical protein
MHKAALRDLHQNQLHLLAAGGMALLGLLKVMHEMVIVPLCVLEAGCVGEFVWAKLLESGGFLYECKIV